MKNGRTGWRLEGAGLWARRGKVVGGATLLRPLIVFDAWTMGALLLGNVVTIWLRGQRSHGDDIDEVGLLPYLVVQHCGCGCFVPRFCFFLSFARGWVCLSND